MSIPVQKMAKGHGFRHVLKTQYEPNKLEVKVLVAGPSVFICDDCVDVCNDIIKDKLAYIEESKESLNNFLSTLVS